MKGKKCCIIEINENGLFNMTASIEGSVVQQIRNVTLDRATQLMEDFMNGHV